MSQAKDQKTTAKDRVVAVAAAATMALTVGACLELAQAQLDQPQRQSQQ